MCWLWISARTDTNEVAKKCRFKSTMSPAVKAHKSTWMRNAKQLEGWGTAGPFEYRGVKIFEQQNTKLKLQDT